jgi:hypothetical protein
MSVSVLVYADDISRSEAFYAAILWRPATEYSPSFALLVAGLRLGLWRHDGVRPPAGRGASGEIAFTDLRQSGKLSH